MKAFLLATLLFAGLLAGGCRFQQQADRKFGDQHFKTAIALIELHRLRFGTYPASLDSLHFTGDWDAIALASVRYERLDSGYALDLVRGWAGKPKDLAYPPVFWHGLGLRRSNLLPEGRR